MYAVPLSSVPHTIHYGAIKGDAILVKTLWSVDVEPSIKLLNYITYFI